MQTAVSVLDTLTFGSGASYGHGSGKCPKCSGSGEIECKTCHGSGDCVNCNGSGVITCTNCSGSGDCPECDHGQVTCTRCAGSGYYQTFITQTSTLYKRLWRWPGTGPYRSLIGVSGGMRLCEDTVKQWCDSRTLIKDTEKENMLACQAGFTDSSELFEEFVSASNKNSNEIDPETSGDMPYSKSFTAQRVPITEINYTINGNEYSLVVVGDDNIVAVKEIPTVMKGFELSTMDKVKIALTYKKRLKAYAALAAYIFQCDGKTMQESRVLNSMVDELHLSENARAKFMRKLESYNQRMPYNEFRKIIKPLLSSKKTITFAWQCMAVDKTITSEEKELFDNIVAEYNCTPEEVKSLQSIASKFTRLDDDQIAKEYVGISTKILALRKRILIMGSVVISAILLIGGMICYTVLRPASEQYRYEQDATEEVIYNDLSDESDLDSEESNLDESPDATAAATATEPFEFIYEGNVGTYPVVMTLTFDEDSGNVWGEYYYTRMGSDAVILLKGSYNVTSKDKYTTRFKMTLYELDNNGNANAGVFDLSGVLSDFAKELHGTFTLKDKELTVMAISQDK